MKQFKTNYQRGAALLLIVAALIMSAAWMSYELMGGLGQKLKRQNSQEVAQALAEAKENLLVFASSIPVLYPNNCPPPTNPMLNCTANPSSCIPCGIGFMPSPDFNNDGSPDGNTSQIIGRLPSRQQGANYFLLHVRDSNQNQWLDTPYPIWYALPATMGSGATSLSIQANSNWNSNKPLNSNVLTQMFNSSPGTICKVLPDGICLDNNGSGAAATTNPVVALLVYAGSPITGQNRPSNNVSDYLDDSNGDGDRIFVKSFPVGQTCQANPNNSLSCFNDIVLPVTLADWTNAMESRVKSEFGSANLASTLCSASWRASNATHWAVVNQWNTVTKICP